MSIDFAKQRENLAELASYIQQKQAKTNDVQSDNVEAPGMLLAEQAEIKSDTLAPEKELTAATETVEVPNGIPAEVQSVQNSQGDVSEESQMQADAFAQVAQVPGDMPVPEPMPASETNLPDNQPSGEIMLDTSAANLGGEVSETVMGADQGAEVASEVAAMSTDQPAVGTVETPGEMPIPEAVSQIPGINNDGTQTELNGESLTPQPETVMPTDVMNSDLSQIPDNTVANADLSTDQPVTYVANGTSSAVIPDATPAPAPVGGEVQLPDGITEAVANDPTLGGLLNDGGPTPSM